MRLDTFRTIHNIWWARFNQINVLEKKLLYILYFCKWQIYAYGTNPWTTLKRKKIALKSNLLTLHYTSSNHSLFSFYRLTYLNDVINAKFKYIHQLVSIIEYPPRVYVSGSSCLVRSFLYSSSNILFAV